MLLEDNFTLSQLLENTPVSSHVFLQDYLAFTTIHLPIESDQLINHQKRD